MADWSAANWARMRVTAGGTGNLTLADVNATTPSLDDKFGAGTTNVAYVIVDSVAGRYERGTGTFNGTTKVLVRSAVTESWTGGTYGTSAVNATTDATVFTGPMAGALGTDGTYGSLILTDNGTSATLGVNTVDTDQLVNDAVTTDKILDGAVTIDKIASGDVVTIAELQTDLGVPATDGRRCDLLFSLSSIANATYVLDAKATFPYTIDGLVIDSLNNTGTVAVQINGVSVTNLSGVSATTTLSDTNATGANSVGVGAAVTLVFTSIATTASFVGKLRVTRG
jgi:hypothetical protein